MPDSRQTDSKVELFGVTLTRRQWTKVIRVTAVLLIALGAWIFNQWQNRPIDPATLPENASETVSILESLPVGEKLEGVYDRDAFGSAWMDVDNNGCDTRNDILARDLTNFVYEDGDNCVVESGDIVDPYTLKEIDFVRGHGTLIDIDHVVALGEAAASGAMDLPEEQREAIANDPLNLLAVDARANRQKGDKDASEWLPPNEEYHCEYVTLQVLVKDKYGLSVSAPEKSAMLKALSTC